MVVPVSVGDSSREYALKETRTSLEKLAAQLRVSREDALRILAGAELRPTPNSAGHIGWSREDVRYLKDHLPAHLREQLQLARQAFETEREARKRDLVPLEEASDLIAVPVEHTQRLLSKLGVEWFLVPHMEERFYDRSELVALIASPTSRQALELKRARSNRKSRYTMTATQLSRVFDVPVPLVAPLKKVLGVKAGTALTEEMVGELVGNPAFPSKRRSVLQTSSVPRSAGNKKDRYVTRYNLAKILGLSHDEIAAALRLNLIPTDSRGRFIREEVQAVNVDSVRRAVDVLCPTPRAEEEVVVAVPTVADVNLLRVDVRIPKRTIRPEIATLYVGPTNSGKTYHALAAMQEAYLLNPNGLHVYSAPLRMLAYEVYCKLVDVHGMDQVGFITGEETINPDAPLLATTVEMTPSSGDTLVLDEAHWMIDPTRGGKWTNILMGSDYEAFHILTAKEAAATIQHFMQDAEELVVREFERKTPLVYQGEVTLAQIPAKTAIVCFSRKQVHKIAAELELQHQRKVGVLYGVLPLAARKHQIQQFVDGEYDIMVTTDVIGHGINLPIDNVVFAETTKFDGVQSRPLYVWEAAQIAGRAGRYGFAEQGTIQFLYGGDVDPELVHMAALAAQGKIPTGMKADRAVLAPSFGDLHVDAPDELRLRLDDWFVKASQLLNGTHLRPSELKEVRSRLKVVEDVIQETSTVSSVPYITGGDYSSMTEDMLTVQATWQLSSGPYDPRLKTLRTLAEWLRAGAEDRKGLSLVYDTEIRGIEDFFNTLDELETAARHVSEFKTANIMFGEQGTGVYWEELDYTEDNVGEEIIGLLRKGIAALETGDASSSRFTKRA